MKLERFIDDLKSLYDGNLESVVLYGSAAAGDFQKKYSDYNLLVVLKDPSVAELGKVSRAIQKWLRSGNPPPLFIDREHISSSLDVFPIEFLDMQENHRVLYGSDPLQGLEIRRDHLRLQCETELKGKMIALRAGFLRAGGSKRLVRRLLLESVPGFFSIFRGILRLMGEPPGLKKSETLAALGVKLPSDISIFGEILDVREVRRSLKRSEILVWMERYLTTVEKISKCVDKMK